MRRRPKRNHVGHLRGLSKSGLRSGGDAAWACGTSATTPFEGASSGRPAWERSACDSNLFYYYGIL
jgi:hypothetical protein